MDKYFPVALVIAISSSAMAPDAVARGFGGVGMGATAGFNTAMSVVQPMMPLSQPFYSNGGYGFGYPYYGGWGSYGGGYYYDDPAEQTYDSSHYWDGEQRDDGSSSSSATQATPDPIAQTSKPSEAELLKDADKTYSWGFDKGAAKPKP